MGKIASRGIFFAGWFSLACALVLALGVGGGFIRISQPKPGAKLSGKVTVRAQAYGIQGLSYVIFGIDAEKPHSTNAEPYQYELDTTRLPDGPHTLFAEAHGRYGLLTASAPVQVIVANQPSVAPRVLVQAPAAKAEPAAAPKVAAPKPAPAAIKTVESSTAPAEKPAAAAPESAAPLPLFPTVAIGTRLPAPEQSASKPGGGLLALAASGVKIPAVASLAPKPIAPPIVAAKPVAPKPIAPTLVAPKLVAPKPVAPKPAAPKLIATTPVVPEGRTVSLEPLIRAGRAFVRFRSMAEGLGHRVMWLHEKKTGVAINGNTRIEITAGSTTAVLNGQSFNMAAAAAIHEDRLVAPSRSCAEMLGAQIAWDANARLIRLSLTPEPASHLAAR